MTFISEITAPGDTGACTALVPRATVEAIVAQRNATLAAYAQAHEALTRASGAIDDARAALSRASPGANAYNVHIEGERAAFHWTLTVPDDYMATARRIVDTYVWSHLVHITDLERLMDKTAKDQLRNQLRDDPPEVTADNVYATLQQFIADSGMIFKRGIAECFSKLDRRFRSHDGWKIGSRMILTYVFDESGYWNYHRNHRDTFADVERVFRVLDDNPAAHCEISTAMQDARTGRSGARQTEIETQYFIVRAFKNGNAHIWFKRDDLLARVNQLLGDYYGAPIPEDREPEENPFANVKHTPAKRYGFFPTPDAAADYVMGEVHLLQDADKPRLRVLEPSAGTGSLARRCAIRSKANVSAYHRESYRFDPAVDCVEIQPGLADGLRAERIYNRVWTADFLQMSPETTGLYDVVVMNPPFDRERDIDHVMHALTFLKPGGQLVAVMSAGTEFRETKKSTAFRELMERMGARWRDMPERSFSEVGTNCNTRLLTTRKPGVTP